MLVAKVKKTRHFERSSKGARVQGRGQNLKDLFVVGYGCWIWNLDFRAILTSPGHEMVSKANKSFSFWPGPTKTPTPLIIPAIVSSERHSVETE